MAEISFPLSPANNEIYTVNGRYWRWDGVSWNSIINSEYGSILYNDNGSANTSNLISISNNTIAISNVFSISNNVVTISNVFSVSSNTVTISNGVVAFQSYTETITNVGVISANYSVNTSLSNIFDITLGANNLIISFVNPPANSTLKSVTVFLKQDNVGSRFVTFANSKYTDGQVPVLSTGADSVDILTFFTPDGGISWYGSFAMANVS